MHPVILLLHIVSPLPGSTITRRLVMLDDWCTLGGILLWASGHCSNSGSLHDRGGTMVVYVLRALSPRPRPTGGGNCFTYSGSQRGRLLVALRDVGEDQLFLVAVSGQAGGILRCSVCIAEPSQGNIPGWISETRRDMRVRVRAREGGGRLALPAPVERERERESSHFGSSRPATSPPCGGGGAGKRPSEAAGCSQQFWRVDVPLSGGRLESYTCRHFASEALWGRVRSSCNIREGNGRTLFPWRGRGDCKTFELNLSTAELTVHCLFHAFTFLTPLTDFYLNVGRGTPSTTCP